MQICEGLVAAHSLDVVHRDLKPQNIFIGTAGEAKVTDFDIARASQMSIMTATGAIVGTPPLYMSPEAAQGESVDKRSDIYSLGCILYEMVAGEVPFDGNSEVDPFIRLIAPSGSEEIWIDDYGGAPPTHGSMSGHYKKQAHIQ